MPESVERAAVRRARPLPPAARPALVAATFPPILQPGLDLTARQLAAAARHYPSG